MNLKLFEVLNEYQNNISKIVIAHYSPSVLRYENVIYGLVHLDHGFLEDDEECFFHVSFQFYDYDDNRSQIDIIPHLIKNKEEVEFQNLSVNDSRIVEDVIDHFVDLIGGHDSPLLPNWMWLRDEEANFGGTLYLDQFDIYNFGDNSFQIILLDIIERSKISIDEINSIKNKDFILSYAKDQERFRNIFASANNKEELQDLLEINYAY